MQRPVPRAAIKYKKPSAINPVSVGLFLILGALGYVGFCYWPTMRLKSSAKSELQESLVQFYRLNLRQDKHQLRNKAALEKTLVGNLRRAGVSDPNLKIDIDMNPKTVSLETHFVSALELVGLDKRYPMDHHIRVETDAARIDW